MNGIHRAVSPREASRRGKSDVLTVESAYKVFIVAFGGRVPEAKRVVDVQRTEGAIPQPHITLDEITGFAHAP